MEQCPLLYKLKIEDNKIESINKLYCLNKIKLRKISIKGNPLFLEKNVNYRNELFNKIGTLEAIDGLGKNEENIESTEYEDEENYYEREDFEEAESGEEKYEENKIQGNEDYEEEEYENEDEHNFDEDKKGDNFGDEFSDKSHKK